MIIIINNDLFSNNTFINSDQSQESLSSGRLSWISLWQGENITITPGDINQDLSIDILDMVLVVNFILGQQDPSNTQFFASDLNSDSIINIQDVILLLNIILN